MTAALRRLSQIPWLAEILAAIGCAWYTWQLWVYAHFQESVLDEGAYVYKGLLFATGQYTPYQPYGPWTNHMPLAFLIPGYIQTWFGPGLRTARYAAIFWGVLLLVGMIILTRRFGNRWWVAAVVWALALNPALLKPYSTGVTQGLVACMLVWILALTLGDNRPLWQIILGSILAGLILMTRFNMISVLPLLALYLGWQYGLRTGLIAAAAGGLAVVFWHVVYWPGIIQGWDRIPRELSPFLDAWRLPASYEGVWNPDISLTGRIASLFHGVRYNFAELVGFLALILLWPRKKSWANSTQFRAVVYLAALFISLIALHLWASLGKDYCVYCFAGYTAFFTQIGLLLVVLTASIWRKQLPLWLQALIVATILVLSAGIGYGAFEQVGERLMNWQIPRWLLGDFRAGSVGLGAILINKFGLEAQFLRRALPLTFGLLLAVVFLLAVAVFLWRSRRKQAPHVHSGAVPSAAPSGVRASRVSYGYWALTLFLIAGTLLSPTAALGGGYQTYDCAGNVLETYEAVGAHLAKTIPPGSQVYWMGPLSVAPLLYTEDIRIYPSQINDGYSMLKNGDDLDLIVRFGHWNETLAQQWANEADIVLIEQRSFKGWLRDVVRGGGFIELEPTPLTVDCRPDSYIRIFQKAP